MADPINEVYTVLFRAFSNDAVFKAKIKRFVDISNPKFTRFLEDINPNDLPEFVLLPQAFSLSPFKNNSKAGEIRQSYTLIITFDSLNAINPLSFVWEINRVLTQFQDDLAHIPELYDVNVTNGMLDPFGKAEWSRKTERYVLTVNINCEFRIDTKKLFNTGA